MATSHLQLVELRRAWEHLTNRQLAKAGLDIRVDHRSHLEPGLEIEPTAHVGVHATQLNRQGRAVSRTRMDANAASRMSPCDETFFAVDLRRDLMLQPDEITAMLRLRKLGWEANDWRGSLDARGRR